VPFYSLPALLLPLNSSGLIYINFKRNTRLEAPFTQIATPYSAESVELSGIYNKEWRAGRVPGLGDSEVATARYKRYWRIRFNTVVVYSIVKYKF